MAFAVTTLPILIVLMARLHVLRPPLGQRTLRYANLDDTAVWGVPALVRVDLDRLARQAALVAVFAVAAWVLRAMLRRVPAMERSPPALQEVTGGRVPRMFDGPATSIPMIKGGKLKVFAVSGTKRSPALTEAPTFAEPGYPTLDETALMLLWSRPDVPADVHAKMRTTALKVMPQPAAPARLRALGGNPKELAGG
jgi:tripartite-type tricarboxylate transporter receptor subunit TctC